MEIELEVEFIVGGKSYKEVRESLQKKVDEFLEGTRGAKVKVQILPEVSTTSLSGFNEIHAWACSVSVFQAVGGSK